MEPRFGTAITGTLLLGVHYVGAGSRHQFLQPLANTAIVPGAGPISARQPYPQFGGPIPWDYNQGTANYHALPVKLKQELAGGLYYLLSYTYAKSMDLASDPQADTLTDFYDLGQIRSVRLQPEAHVILRGFLCAPGRAR